MESETVWEHQQTGEQSLFSFSFQRHQKSETRRRKRRMVKGTNQIITMLQFYLYLFFAFYILSWRRVLKRARDLLGHLTGSPRLCVWGARWSDRDPPCLPNVATSSWFAPHPGWSAPRLLVQSSAAFSAACVCKTHSLCLEQELACLLRCCLLQKSAAAFCQSSLWDPIVGRLNAVPVMRRRIIIMMMVKMKMIIVETQLSAGSMSLWWGGWEGFGWPYYWWWEDFFCCYFLFINTTKKCFQFSCLWNKEKFLTTEIMHSFPGHFCNMWNWF